MYKGERSPPGLDIKQMEPGSTEGGRGQVTLGIIGTLCGALFSFSALCDLQRISPSLWPWSPSLDITGGGTPDDL